MRPRPQPLFLLLDWSPADPSVDDNWSDDSDSTRGAGDITATFRILFAEELGSEFLAFPLHLGHDFNRLNEACRCW